MQALANARLAHPPDAFSLRQEDIDLSPMPPAQTGSTATGDSSNQGLDPDSFGSSASCKTKDDGIAEIARNLGVGTEEMNVILAEQAKKYRIQSCPADHLALKLVVRARARGVKAHKRASTLVSTRPSRAYICPCLVCRTATRTSTPNANQTISRVVMITHSRKVNSMGRKPR